MSKSIIKRITIEFISNGIILLNNNELTTYEIASVENYHVINRKTFLKDLQTILNKNKINPELEKTNLSIIIDKTYHDIDKKNLQTIFKLLKLGKIEYLNIPTILSLENTEIALDISIGNIKIYHKENVYHSQIYFNKYNEIIYLYLNKLVKLYNINTIKVFGTNEDIPKICEYLEKKLKIKVFIYSYSNEMPIKLFT